MDVVVLYIYFVFYGVFYSILNGFSMEYLLFLGISMCFFCSFVLILFNVLFEKL